MMRAAVLALLAAVPGAAAAQSFGLPQGCEAYVTVQKRNCTVSHLFRCSGDPAGQQRRVDMDESGVTYEGLIDAETQWLESWHVLADSVDVLVPGAADPASFTTLTGTGLDTFVFSTLTDDQFETVYRGQDRLTGETMVIDGVTLDRTEFSVAAYDPDGAELWRTEGSEFIHREWRTFLSGSRTTTTPTETWSDDGTPVTFSFPGEDGFLTSSPHHGCGVMLSSAPVVAPFSARGFDR